MSGDQGSKKATKAPEKNHPDDKVRNALQAVIDAAPLGGTIRAVPV